MTTVEDARQALRNRLVEGSAGFMRGEEFDLLEQFLDAKLDERLGPRRGRP